MKRRELLAGIGALGVFGTGAAYHFGAVEADMLPGVGEEEDDDVIEPLELSRIDAPGSDPGTEVVPEEGTVTYVAFFATWCGTCATKMESLGEAAATVADDEDVQFVSVTSEALGQTVTEDDVVEWWEDHDGNWTVAHDESLDLTMAVDAGGVPYSAVIDADNELVWSAPGYKTADELLDAIDEAR